MPKTHDIAALVIAVSAAQQPGGAWVQLIPAGKFAGRDGRGPFDSGNVQEMKAIVDRSLAFAGTTTLVVDYDHQTDFGAIDKVGGTAPAAGWIEEMDVRADGIWGRVKWTEKAKTAIHADEYRYLSPVFDHMKDGKVYRLRRAALTNTPNLELQKVAASARHNIHDEEEEDMDKVLKALGLSNDAGETGAVKAIEAMSQFITAAMKVFGLADDAKTEELLQAIQSAAGSTATLKKITDAAGIKDKEGDALVTAIQSAMSNKSDSVPDPEKYVPIGVVTELRDQLNTIQSAHSDRSAKEAVAKAMEDGQITPAQETWALALHKQNPKSFEDFISGAPKLTQSQLSQTRKPGDPGAGLTDSDKAVMSQLGIAQDKFLETRKAEQA